MNKNIQIYLMIKDILENHGDMIDNLHIIENESVDEESFRIYHGDGYCFDINKEYICEPDEVDGFEDVEPDGFMYSTYFGWDGFKPCDENIVIDLLSNFTKIIN